MSLVRKIMEFRDELTLDLEPKNMFKIFHGCLTLEDMKKKNVLPIELEFPSEATLTPFLEIPIRLGLENTILIKLEYKLYRVTGGDSPEELIWTYRLNRIGGMV